MPETPGLRRALCCFLHGKVGVRRDEFSYTIELVSLMYFTIFKKIFKFLFPSGMTVLCRPSLQARVFLPGFLSNKPQLAIHVNCLFADPLEHFYSASLFFLFLFSVLALTILCASTRSGAVRMKTMPWRTKGCAGSKRQNCIQRKLGNEWEGQLRFRPTSG